MARKKRIKQDTQNATGREAKETRVKINCLRDNAIIIKKPGENIKVKANNPRETSYRRKAKKQVEFEDTMRNPNFTTSIENTAKNSEKITEKKRQQIDVNVHHYINDKVVKPKAILADINKPKRTQKKDKKDIISGSKTNKSNRINEFKKMLYKIFIGYRHMTATIEKKLKQLGFSIKRKKNHLILTLLFNGNEHTFTISTSASDNLCGYKIVSTIINTISM